MADAPQVVRLLGGILRGPVRQQHIGQRTTGQQAGEPIRKAQHQNRQVTKPRGAEGGRQCRLAHQAEHPAEQQQTQGHETGAHKHGVDYRAT